MVDRMEYSEGIPSNDQMAEEIVSATLDPIGERYQEKRFTTLRRSRIGVKVGLALVIAGYLAPPVSGIIEKFRDVGEKSYQAWVDNTVRASYGAMFGGIATILGSMGAGCVSMSRNWRDQCRREDEAIGVLLQTAANSKN